MSNSDEFAKGQWHQLPLFHTPRELKSIANRILDPAHKEFSQNPVKGNTKKTDNEVYYTGRDKESATGECDSICNMVHDSLPHGSHIVEYARDSGGNHFVHHVPTTHGTYVVDFTQRQFNARAKLPVVEHFGKFAKRQSMKEFNQLNMSHPERYRTNPDGTIDYNQ